MELGDNYYNPNNPAYANSFLEKYKTAQMGNTADFYGKVADEHGAKADALEENSSLEDNYFPEEKKEDSSAVGSALSKGGSPMDMASNGLMASGNPYAMAAGGALKVASMGQQRQQAKLNAQRAAFVDRNNRIREATDKILSMDFGI